MLDPFQRETVSEQVSRLIALPTKPVEAILVARGIPLEDLDEVKAALASVGAVVTPRDAVRYTFTRNPILPQRYNTAQFPTFYTAQDHNTCIAEIKYHMAGYIAAFEIWYYHFLEVAFSGDILNLVGHEVEYPDLVSASDAGYPFCQKLATAARDEGIEGLHAPSARRSGGVCVPIFFEKAISHPAISSTVRLSIAGTVIEHEEII